MTEPNQFELYEGRAFMSSFHIRRDLFLPIIPRKEKKKKNASSSLLVSITLSLVFLFCFLVGIFAQFFT
jgi:hypothetical protein